MKNVILDGEFLHSVLLGIIGFFKNFFEDIILCMMCMITEQNNFALFNVCSRAKRNKVPYRKRTCFDGLKPEKEIIPVQKRKENNENVI